MLKSGRSYEANVSHLSPPNNVQGGPCKLLKIPCASRELFDTFVSSKVDAMRMLQEDMANPGTWMLGRYNYSADYINFQFLLRGIPLRPARTTMVRLHIEAAAALTGYTA